MLIYIFESVKKAHFMLFVLNNGIKYFLRLTSVTSGNLPDVTEVTLGGTGVCYRMRNSSKE